MLFLLLVLSSTPAALTYSEDDLLIEYSNIPRFALEGDTVMLSCQESRDRNFTFRKWFKENQEIYNEMLVDGHHAVRRDPGLHQDSAFTNLTINNITWEMSGQYRCEVTGTSQSSFSTQEISGHLQVLKPLNLQIHHDPLLYPARIKCSCSGDLSSREYLEGLLGAVNRRLHRQQGHIEVAGQLPGPEYLAVQGNLTLYINGDLVNSTHSLTNLVEFRRPKRSSQADISAISCVLHAVLEGEEFILKQDLNYPLRPTVQEEEMEIVYSNSAGYRERVQAWSLLALLALQFVTLKYI